MLGNHVTATIAGAQGHLERKVFEPVIIQNVLQSCWLLTDSAVSFARNMVDVLQPNREHIAERLAGWPDRSCS